MQHLDLTSCMESPDVVYESKGFSLIDNKFQFTCQGDVARTLYHRVGYLLDNPYRRSVGLNGNREVIHRTRNSFLRCFPDSKILKNNIVSRDYKCLVELTAAPDALSIKGNYANKIFNGDYRDQKQYISKEFTDKDALMKVQFRSNGKLNVVDAQTYCRPTTRGFKNETLKYSCTATAMGPSIVILFPKI